MSIEHTAKCPKISCTDISDKMAYANGADPDQTVPAVLSGSTLFAIPQSILKRNNCLESKQLPRKQKPRIYGIKFS